MKDFKHTCKIALVQAEPILFDKDASLAKALKYIEEAAEQNAEQQNNEYFRAGVCPPVNCLRR